MEKKNIKPDSISMKRYREIKGNGRLNRKEKQQTASQRNDTGKLKKMKRSKRKEKQLLESKYYGGV